MLDFTDAQKVLIELAAIQDAESDQREAAREAKHFITKRDGQWDPDVISKFSNRFRGTFDMCGPIVDNIAGEIEQSDFTLRVSPAGGDASESVAKTYDGLIRNIRNISNAEHVFNQAGRSNVIGGFDAWEVVQDWVDGDSMDQDLFIRRIPSAVDSVWFFGSPTMQDASDASGAIILTAIPVEEYRDKYPDGSGHSIGDDRSATVYWNKIDAVIVGRLIYKKPVDIEIVRMNNGSVYSADDYEEQREELELSGVVIETNDGEEKRRTRKSFEIHSRLLDGNDWLIDSEETAFNQIPVVPVYGNFDVVENKVIYSGKIERLFDQQRVLNYAMSRDIEDGALSPKKKYWATPEQIEGHTGTLQTLNTNNEPLQQYNHVEGQPPPFMQGGVEASQGLQTTIANMQQMITTGANQFTAQQGNANPTQSGVAGAQQIEQGNIGSIKWFKSLEIAICRTGKILINAIPKVYDSTRQVRILEEDGTGKMVTLHDQLSGGEILDLSQGEYDVVCNVGAAFNNQQKEMASAFLEAAAINPQLFELGSDIWLKNQQTPGMEQIAERDRELKINSGVIPEKQWTDEERAEIEQAQAEAEQQAPEQDAASMEAQGVLLTGQADMQNAQNKQSEIQGNQQISVANIQLENRKIDLRQQEIQLDTQKFIKGQDDKFNVDAATIQQNQEKIDLSSQQQQFDNFLKVQQQQQQEIKDAINNLKVLREAMGVDAIVGPHNQKAYIDQAKIVDDIQEDTPTS